jgi:hypothetical protein
MRLTVTALSRIDELETRLRLALALKVTERRVSQMIKENKENGSLTTLAALQIIKKETGLSQSQILETSGIAA